MVGKSDPLRSLARLSAISLIFLLGFAAWWEHDTARPPRHTTGLANPKHLRTVYQRWQARYTRADGARQLILPLHAPKTSALAFTAAGEMRIDLLDGAVTARVTGLAPDNHYRLWLLTERDDSATPADPTALDLGTLTYTDDQHLLTAQLERARLAGVRLQQVVLTVADASPAEMLMSGAPDLLQKIYYANKPWRIADVGRLPHADTPDRSAPLFAFLLPQPAFAADEAQLDEALAQQVARGREIFLHETFDGNGRTCATCHREDNNHTIDPRYIAELPDNDPLFVHERDPALAGLENAKLLRQLGLFMTHVNGFDKPPVFRSAPHLLALNTSLIPEPEKEGKVVTHALGWSADGGPDDGSLRLFTIGAIMQHLPKTLQRQPGVDFRLPTEEELDALEAYMLSLGRDSDPDLDNLFFASPLVQRGRELFHSKDPGTGQCKGCHFNGGANSSTTLANGNRDTGVENMRDNAARLVWQPAPVDGGFGNDARHDCGWNRQKECYGNGEFNMTTVIEAADTAPYFHNNAVNTLEEAIAFYNTPAFHASPGAEPPDPALSRPVCTRCITLESSQVTAIALFLRTLNVMENLRSSNELDQQALDLLLHDPAEARHVMRLALADTEDAVEVMAGGQLIPYPEAFKLLRQAQHDEQDAIAARSQAAARALLQQAMQAKQRARDLMLLDTQRVDALFDWAEREYPDVFPAHVASKNIQGYYARHYPATGVYLGVKGDRVYGFRSGSQTIEELGTLAQWFARAGV